MGATSNEHEDPFAELRRDYPEHEFCVTYIVTGGGGPGCSRYEARSLNGGPVLAALSLSGLQEMLREAAP